jgi:thymidylate synthase ThyX
MGTPDGVPRTVDALRAYTERPGGRWKYHVPAEIEQSPLRERFTRTLDAAFETYAKWIPAMEAHFRAKHPKSPEDSDAVYRSVIRAKALDTLRGLLPAATRSNVGLFGTGQAFEALLLRMFAHPLDEVRGCAQQMLAELRQVIPAFLARWISRTAAADGSSTSPTRGARSRPRRSRSWTMAARSRGEVTLTDFDPDGETRWWLQRCTPCRRCRTISCSRSPNE